MGRSELSHRGSIDGEPAYCPACDLKHVRQPDWLCPRCGLPVETEAWRTAVGRSGVEPEAEKEFPRGSFVAGAVLALTGAILTIGFARHPSTPHRWPLVAAMVILGILGLELLLKVARARWVALGVSLVALILVVEDQLRVRAPELMPDPLPAAARAALQGLLRLLDPLRTLLAAGMLVGVLVLVFGRPGRGRIVAGALLAAPLALAEIVRWFVG
jgi:hypothetical protein